MLLSNITTMFTNIILTTENSWTERFFNYIGETGIANTLVLSLYAAIIVKVFNWGRLSRAELVTKDDLNKFEQAIRADMNNYKKEIRDYVINIMNEKFNNLSKQINEYRKTFDEVKILEALLKDRMTQFDSMKKQLDNVNENYKILERKMSISNNTNANNKTTQRREG